MSAAEIDAYRRAAFRGLVDRFQHPWIGMDAEHAAAYALEGRVLDADGEEVLSVFDMAEVIPIPDTEGELQAWQQLGEDDLVVG
ncbi:hypothetical protein [Methylobacterium pseudosasicola]|uniref:Uncharacterized protein n=1 Tax=Methylobacterium pseudosasicola TaxID=582667 RepID=A0A1I4QLX5_9HYPH|nr:hypothetical protein [Methylobacterium pseudosasicola]SFM41057.1 hypothetical protein SAMN05192568_103058 [Methylobacterium pseudosasicola]